MEKSALVEVAHAFCFITIVNSELSNPNQPTPFLDATRKKRDNGKEEGNGNGHLCHAIFSSTERGSKESQERNKRKNKKGNKKRVREKEGRKRDPVLSVPLL